MTDDRDIFDDESPATTTEGVSPEAPDTARDDKGRFAAKDTGDQPAPAEPAIAAPAPEPVKDAPPASVDKKEPHLVPLATVLDDREKRQKAEADKRQSDARVAMLERQLAAIQQQNQPKQPLPDPVEDSEGYTRTIIGTLGQQMQAAMLRQSEFFAKREFGDELLGETMAFLDNQPRHVSEQFLREASPFHAAVEWFKQHKEAAERASPDYEAKLRAEIAAGLREELKAEMKAQIEAEHAAAAAESVPRPKAPRSLAAAPGSGYAPPDAGGGDPLFD
jgi:hypothetical protein